MKGLSDDNDNVISYDWTNYDTSKFLSTEILEMYRQQLPKLAFKSEFLGEFIDGDGSVFTNFKECVGVAKLDKTNELWISVDWGTGQGKDSTVLTIGQLNEDKVQVANTIGFNDKNTNETIEYIVKIVKEYVKLGFKDIHIIVEKNSIGQVFFDLLTDKVDEYETGYNAYCDWRDEISVRCSTFITSNKSKEKIIKRKDILQWNLRTLSFTRKRIFMSSLARLS